VIEALIAQTEFADSARIVCPFCSNERRKKNLKELSLTRKPDGAVVYYCHHCTTSGSIQPHKERQLSAVPSPKIFQSGSLNANHSEYLKSRGISEATAKKLKLFGATKYFTRLGKETDSIGFPYYRDGALVGVKYRSFPEKDFTAESGGQYDFFGLDQVVKGEPLIIVEGEIDALTLHEVGITNVVSVPSGAPMKVADGKMKASEDKKFSFVWNAREYLDAAPYIILATDQDVPGQALAEELARRIGKEKCRLAKFAQKDLNEVWLSSPSPEEGTTVIRGIIDAASPYPISGLSDAATYVDRLNDMYAQGVGKGLSTGYSSVDQIYTVAPGQLTVVTGYPSSGKSNFVDQVMVNLARGADWKFAVCSFENQPETHIVRLMEIYTGKRFFDGRDRMTAQEKDHAFKWVNDHFIFMDHHGEEPSNLPSILERAKAAVKRMGVRGMVIDPYNYIDMDRRDMAETEAISNMLTKVRQFCMAYDVHCWFVAHPAKMNRSGNEQPRPDGMSISGSMAWWAKTDCGITVHRKEGSVEIAVWKCRYRWIGTQGETELIYNKTAGTYEERLDAF
jgi:twinkle protein